MNENDSRLTEVELRKLHEVMQLMSMMAMKLRERREANFSYTLEQFAEKLQRDFVALGCRFELVIPDEVIK